MSAVCLHLITDGISPLFNGFNDLFNDWGVDNFSWSWKGILNRGGYRGMGNVMTGIGISGMTGNGITGMTGISITGMTGIGIRKHSISIGCGKDDGKNNLKKEID